MQADTDTELSFLLETDGSEVPSDDVAKELEAADSADIVGHLKSVPDVAEVMQNVFVEKEACEADDDACAAKKCGWVVDSCGIQRQCGNCGFTSDCTAAVSKCITGGDCSTMVADLLDDARTIDGCLADTSQL